MIDKLLRLLNKNFVLYAVIGVSGVTIDLVVYYVLLTYFDVNYQLANWFSTSLGIGNNFLLNAFLNFGKTDRLWSRFLKFYAIGFLGVVVTALLLFALVEMFEFHAMISKAFAVVIVFLLQYTLNKKVSFKDHE